MNTHTISKTFSIPNSTKPLSWIASNDTCYGRNHFTIYVLPQGKLNIGRYCSVIRNDDGFDIADDFGFTGRGQNIKTAVQSFVAAATMSDSKFNLETVATGPHETGIVWWTSNQMMPDYGIGIPIIIMPTKNIVEPFRIMAKLNDDESVELSINISGARTGISIGFVDQRRFMEGEYVHDVFNQAVYTAVAKLTNPNDYDIISRAIVTNARAVALDRSGEIVSKFNTAVLPVVSVITNSSELGSFSRVDKTSSRFDRKWVTGWFGVHDI